MDSRGVPSPAICFPFMYSPGDVAEIPPIPPLHRRSYPTIPLIDSSCSGPFNGTKYGARQCGSRAAEPPESASPIVHRKRVNTIGKPCESAFDSLFTSVLP